MACASFDPELPVDTDTQQTAWLEAWQSNVLNDTCLQSSCGHTCISQDDYFSVGCQTCLAEANCSTSLACSNCAGEYNFDRAYNCTVNFDLMAGEILAIALSTVVIAFLIIFIGYVIHLVMVNYNNKWSSHNVQSASQEATYALSGIKS